jgi:hypothetical protein
VAHSTEKARFFAGSLPYDTSTHEDPGPERSSITSPAPRQLTGMLAPASESKRANLAPPNEATRRSGDSVDYGARCFAANSSFNDPTCNCFGKPRTDDYDLRPIIRVVLGSWCAHTRARVACAGAVVFAPASPHRLGGAIDAFLLKIVIEEKLGFGVDIVPDGLSIASELSGVDDIYTALSAGQVHIYPEASSSECRARGTAWPGRGAL